MSSDVLKKRFAPYNRVIALHEQPRAAAVANFRIGNIYMAQGKFGNAQVAFRTRHRTESH